MSYPGELAEKFLSEWECKTGQARQQNPKWPAMCQFAEDYAASLQAEKDALEGALRELLVTAQEVAFTECPFENDSDRYVVAKAVAEAALKGDKKL